MTCQETTISLGVYLLGALEPAERAAVDAHLAGCAECREQLAELAGLPSVLERLELADLEPLLAGHDAPVERLTPSEDLFSRVAARVEDEDTVVRRVRFGRYQKLTAVAAAVVVVAGIGIGLGARSHGGSKTPVIQRSASQGPVDMLVLLNAKSAKTSMHITVSGVPAEEHCRLIAVSSDGTRELAGQWTASYVGWADFSGSTSIPLDRLDKLVLLGSNGERLDTVRV